MVDNLLGIDPLLCGDLKYENGLTIQEHWIHQVEGEWDLIMFHHSLEHMVEQLDTLAAAAGLLSPGGQCIIRTPVAYSLAWQ